MMRTAEHKANARFWGVIGLAAAVALPTLAWHGLVTKLVAGFALDLDYLVAAWSGFVLMALGLVLLTPVVWSIGGNPRSRLYPRSRNALAGWGASLYLLGVLLAAQLSQIAANV